MDQAVERRAAHLLRGAGAGERAGILQAMGLTEALEAPAGEPSVGWVPLWAAGNRSAFHLTLRGHEGPVLAVSVGGRGLVASGGADQTIRLWNGRTGVLLSTLTEHTGAVVALAMNDRVLASAGTDGTLRLWNPQNGAALRVIPMPGGDPIRLVLLRDLVLVAFDMTVESWNVATGEHVTSIELYNDMPDGDFDDDPVGLVAVPELDLIATMESDFDGGRVIHLRDPTTGAVTATLPWPGPSDDPDLDDAELVPPLVVAGTRIGATTVLPSMEHYEPNRWTGEAWWDARTGDLVVNRELGRNRTLSAGGPAGRVAILTTRDRRYRSDEIVSPDIHIAQGADLHGHAGHVHAAAFGTVGDRTVLATAGADGDVLVWDADDDLRTSNDSGPVAYVADPDRPVLVAGVNKFTLAVRAAASGAVTGHLRCHAYPGQPGHHCPDLVNASGRYMSLGHCGFAVAAGVVDGRWLVASSGDGTGVPLWDPRTGEVVRVIAEKTPARALAFDGQLLATASWVSTSSPQVWDASTGEQTVGLDWPGRIERTEALAFGTADGRPVLAGATRGAVTVWDLANGARLADFAAVSSRLAATTDRLAMTDGERVLLADLTTGRRTATIEPADGAVTATAFVTKGRLVTGTERGTVRVWDTSTARPLATLATFARPVAALATGHLDGLPTVFARATTGRLVACRLTHHLRDG
ncbi:hypothetical protein Val02_30430 [Virgisporangium aliadipatigenens]|uniref:WD40 repeat domain-containing protein n=1 Tax=Virgisporangium aliadipatigenens TaxID=741659 RepID=A0A8J3YKM1_9ACTN|nr:WD40 repeat domain-containing protein [Virgisporangium aliadipatigenens]GIJ46157.1 hypothetical protein Val02_30430 [Virgisporangium aliadipatigenens]